MDLRIGLTHTPKELEIQLPEDTDPSAIQTQVEVAISASTTLWLTDRKGRQVGVPGAKLAYIEIGSPNEERRIGFGG